jgi:hypothetical protein
VTEREQIAVLLDAVTDLTDRVQAMAGQLELVNEFLRQDLDAAAIRAFDQASLALSEARDLDAKAVTLEEIERRERVREERERRARRKRNWRIAGGVIVLIVALAILSGFVHATRQTNERLDRGLTAFTVTSYDACQSRNTRTVQQRQLYTRLAAIEVQEQAQRPTPQHEARITAFNTAASAVPPLEDCGIYRALSLRLNN